MEAAFNFFYIDLKIHHLMKRAMELGMFVDEEEGDIDDESDVELDGNVQLDLESDLLSDSEDRVGSAEEFQWSSTLPEQALSLRILIYKYNTPPHQLSFLNFSQLMIL